MTTCKWCNGTTWVCEVHPHKSWTTEGCQCSAGMKCKCQGPQDMARPSLYKPEYCEEVVELGKEGKSLAQMCSHFDISRQTIDNWAAQNEEFLEALTRAKAHCQAWWEKAGQEGMFLGGGGFNAAVWKKSMEARFREDYTERQEVVGDGGGPLQVVIQKFTAE